MPAAVCSNSYSFWTGSTLYRVNVVKPKAGMNSAFEASWKLHLDKYHNATDKRMVSQITDGSMNGSFVIMEGQFPMLIWIK